MDDSFYSDTLKLDAEYFKKEDVMSLVSLRSKNIFLANGSIAISGNGYTTKTI